jgi:hypothetical protein
VKDPHLYFEMLSPPQSLFHHFPNPFIWLTLSKNEVISGNGLMRGVIPVTLFTRDEKGIIHYLASALLSRLSDQSNRTILNMDRLCISSKEEERSRIFKLMLGRVAQLAHQMNVDRIDVELYTKVKEPVCFPSGASYLDSWNSPDLPRFFTENGFIAKEKRYCLTCDLSNKRFAPLKEVKAIRVRDIQQYISLNHTGRHLIKHNRKILFGPRSLASRNMVVLADPRLTLVTEAKGFLKKGLSGVVNWTVDIYPYQKVVGTKAFHHDLNTILGNLKLVRTGKIFNIIVKKDRLVTFQKLCLGAIGQMKAMGLSFCQIGNISEKERELLHFLREKGFTIAQVTKIFSRPLSQL